MTYQQWRALVWANGWTIAQLRCDERPSQEMLAAMDVVGLDAWERYVARLCRANGWE